MQQHSPKLMLYNESCIMNLLFCFSLQLSYEYLEFLEIKKLKIPGHPCSAKKIFLYPLSYQVPAVPRVH